MFSKLFKKHSQIGQTDISLPALKHAIEHHLLEPFYLPVVNLKEQKTVELEALLRWPVAEDRYIPPMDFIPFAVENGIMKKLSRSLITKITDLIQSWQKKRIFLNWSINVSSEELKDLDLLKFIKQACSDKEIDIKTIGVEVNHSIIKEASDDELKYLSEFHQAGVRIIIDNFDCHSDIAQIPLLDMWDSLKIDRMIMLDIRHHPERLMKVRQLVNNQSLQNRLCITGINSHYEWNKIQTIQNVKAQGFYFSPPQFYSDLQSWLLVSDWGNQFLKQSSQNNLKV